MSDMTDNMKYYNWLKVMNFIQFLEEEDYITQNTYNDMMDNMMDIKECVEDWIEIEEEKKETKYCTLTYDKTGKDIWVTECGAEWHEKYTLLYQSFDYCQFCGKRRR